MLQILRAFDADLDPDQTLQLLMGHLQKVEETYNILISQQKKWPTFPSSEPAPKTDLSLQPYKVAFSTLKLLLNPTDDKFQELIQIKKDVHRAREDLNVALQSKAMVGSRLCLEKAKILKQLFAKQREAENLYIETLLHKWKTAIDTFHADLAKAGKSPESDNNAQQESQPQTA